MLPRTLPAGKKHRSLPGGREALATIGTRQCRRGIHLSSATVVLRPVLFPSVRRVRQGRQNRAFRDGGNSAPVPRPALGECRRFTPYATFLLTTTAGRNFRSSDQRNRSRYQPSSTALSCLLP